MPKSRLVKENIALWVGVSLPVLLVIVFWIATAIPKMTVADPRYDMLYTAEYYDYNAQVKGSVRLDVHEGKLRATFHSRGSENYRNTPRIFYFDVTSGSTHELNLEIPGDLRDGQLLHIPEANAYTLSNESIAPDGYSFDGSYISRTGLFFFDGGYRYRGIIRKDGRAIKIPSHGGQFQGDLRFLGWVLEGGPP